MAKLILILGDQLSPALASLRQWQQGDVIVLAEVQAEAGYVRHHQHKIVLIFSAMRHFANSLREQGMQVKYFQYKERIASLYEAVASTLSQQPELTEVLLTEAAEYRLAQEISAWPTLLKRPVTVLPDDRFIASTDMFRRWADGRSQFRMEYFYREMRRYTGLLMNGNEPEGGKWNYDHDNRQSCPAHLVFPKPEPVAADAITAEVIQLVQQEFSGNIGDAGTFCLAVTGKDARAVFLDFVTHQLPLFGQYQDAMQLDQPFLFHSISAMYLNIGLLDVRWMCQKVEQAYREGKVPLNAAEGFIRQLIGWREYVRGLYWLLMPDYKTHNYFAAERALPAYYWHGNTSMRCMQQAISHTIKHAYSHHIQRLMITGNFALLAGLSVAEMNEWYLAVYADAFEWVQLPNTSGMALFADGGVLASKPYAASGNYIQRMSNYCQHCSYQVKKVTGEGACPFNALYWDFLARNEDKLATNARMQLAYQQWRRKPAEAQQAIRDYAKELLIKLEKL
ncbi:cryptochrome/photolyase family protein [Rheinheimera sp.]|uniref:cryptochrome/photolyase family protein n=1 Tax=Rheinheimera sp. TaxID=1869214 RepID=UPI0027B88930|nr:cryptochrome/photolyase family protein [Rheinheimera sp.]